MKIYNYHPVTGEYIGETIADESPLEPGVYLIPANATSEAPPITGEYQQAIYNNGWQIVDVQPVVEVITEETINQQVREKISLKYDYAQEIQMLNKGLDNPNDTEYLEYKTYRQECIDWGTAQKQLL